MASPKTSDPKTDDEIPVAAVDNPILWSPYTEPGKHWHYEPKTGAQTRREGRRVASYYWLTEKTGTRQQSLLRPDFEDLPLVNWLRDDVRRWRDSGYRGATPVTKTLLAHWTRPDRSRKLFFCQREAIETLIFLAELILDQTPDAKGRYPCGFKPRCVYERFERYRWALPDDAADWAPDDPRRAYPTPLHALHDGETKLRRLGAKMATGSGKTVVMAMLAAWALCNRGAEPSDTRFPGNLLVIGPNLTVANRLRVLLPEEPQSYYQVFDIVPFKYRAHLRPGLVRVLNWHKLAPEGVHVEGGKSYTVVNKGVESDVAFARRILGDGYDRGELLVFNDEAHHAWRPAVPPDEVTDDARDELEEATVWVDGLDRLHRGLGIRFVADLSATPFYIKGSGQPEGTPFPWLVSEFGLVDAIECGIVKIPRLPIIDTTGRPEPRYFRLWHNIVAGLQPGDRLPGRAGKPKPEAVWRDGQDALTTLAAQWKGRYDQVRAAGRDRIPPVLIVVCDNTDIAKLWFEFISGEHVEENVEEDDGKPRKRTRTVYGTSAVLPEFTNTAARRHTLRIDSKQLAAAESEDGEATRDEAAMLLRRIVDTVGKPGEPGEYIRCVVSVAMLTEGWDANNVTHILGLRAFGSQLLCEQVVGRGLRRMDYDPDPETGLLRAEYVDVYGIPFSIVPFKGRSTRTPEPDDKPQTWVRAREERAPYTITFPVVEGYVFALEKGLIRCDVDRVSPIRLTPETSPTGLFVKPQVGNQPGVPSMDGPGEAVQQNRQAFYDSTHLQTIQFEIARRVVAALASTTANGKLRHTSRHQLFPQVYRIVERFVARRVDWNGVPDHRELGHERYLLPTVDRLVAAIEPDTAGGEPPLLPILNRFQPRGSTAGVSFKTTRACFDTQRSHIDHVVADTDTWEQSAAYFLEVSEVVAFYVKNDHLDFAIPYEFLTVAHTYLPDFVVRFKDGRTLILEIKGVEDEQDRQKHEAARRWVEAVNNWGEMGRWLFHTCRNPQMLGRELEGLATSDKR